MKKNANKALTNENTAAQATATPPPLPVQTPVVSGDTPTAGGEETPATEGKPAPEAPVVEVVNTKKQITAGVSVNVKRAITELGEELKGLGKTGKLINMPEKDVLEMLHEIATDHRFRTETDTEGNVTHIDRFQEFATKFYADRVSEKPQTVEELQAAMAAIQAKLVALGLKSAPTPETV